MSFCELMFKNYPKEYAKMEVDAFNATVPFGSNVKKVYKVYISEKSGSYVDAQVKYNDILQLKFWDFRIFCAKTQKIYCLSTGSGELEDYFKTMKRYSGWQYYNKLHFRLNFFL